MRPRSEPYVIAGVATAAVVSLIAYATFRTPDSNLSNHDDHADAHAIFCADGMETLADDACFAAPSGEARGVVVYLHGRYSPETAGEELERQSRVARLAHARGFGVLALRGVQGECSAPEYKNYFCFPSNPRNSGDAADFIARMTPFIAIAKRRSPGPMFLLGFSNGAYFASLIAERALVPFDAVAIAHGGPVVIGADTPRRDTPVLLMTADDDASDPEMEALDRELTRRNWLHEMVAREGGHALPDWDVEIAMTFFARTRTEKLPLSPPLANRSHHLARIVPDADVDDAADASDQ